MGLVADIADNYTRIGDAIAAGAERRGQIWGQTFSTLGQIPGQVIQQAQQQRASDQESQLRAQQLQAGQLELQQRQAQAKAQAIMGSALARYTKPDGTMDTTGMIQDVANSGSPQLIPDLLETSAKADKARAEALDAKMASDTAQRNLAGSVGAEIQPYIDAGDWENAAGHSITRISQLVKDGLIPADAGQALVLQMDPSNPAGIQQAQRAMLAAAPEYNKPISTEPGAQTSTLARMTTGQPPLQSTPIQPKTEAELAADAATLGTPKETPTAKSSTAAFAALRAPTGGTQSKDVLLDGKSAVVNFDPKSGKYLNPGTGEDVSARVRPIPPASMQINPALVPSGDALTMAANKYLMTGELPPMGMGQAGAAARVAVMNQAAKIDPTASLARNQAAFKADSGNLANLQKTEGTLSAFESTAGKNIDQFLTLADKIPDTGVPWLNTPVRLLNKNMVGSANMAAIDAARDVAMREIARVTNDPKLSGALTDTARAEVAGLNPQNATLPQIKAVARVLKQDMANVHAGITQQIDAVKSGIGANPAAPAATGASGQKLRVVGPNGEKGTVPAGTPLPAGWKVAP